MGETDIGKYYVVTYPEARAGLAAEIATLFERKVIWEGIWKSTEDGEVIELYNLVKDGQRVRVVVIDA